MPHLPRLTRELRALLDARRVGALGTIGDDGAPLVSMVPFALERQLGCTAGLSGQCSPAATP